MHLSCAIGHVNADVSFMGKYHLCQYQLVVGTKTMRLSLAKGMVPLLSSIETESCEWLNQPMQKRR